MSSFTEFDAFEPVAEGSACYRMKEPVRWEIGMQGSGWILSIPTGFEFDISVPRCLRWFLSPHDPVWLVAAAGHDILLIQGQDRPFAAAEMRRMGEARIRRAIRDGKIKRDRRAWIIFFAVLIWTSAPKRKRRD